LRQTTVRVRKINTNRSMTAFAIISNEFIREAIVPHLTLIMIQYIFTSVNPRRQRDNENVACANNCAVAHLPAFNYSICIQASLCNPSAQGLSAPLTGPTVKTAQQRGITTVNSDLKTFQTIAMS